MYRRRRFGAPRRPGARSAPVLESTGVQAKRRTKCAGCGSPIEVGEQFVRLRLRKVFRAPCPSCHRPPKGAKRYHTRCKPSDVNAAMNYVPGTPPRPAARGGAVPPPPKPPTPEELTLEAFASLEAALVAQVRSRKKAMTPELEKEFKTFQGIKARVLRPGTQGEADAATLIGLQRLVKMVLA